MGVVVAASLPQVGGQAGVNWGALQRVMQEALLRRGYHGGVLVVVKEGEVVFEQGFGWADRAKKRAMPSNALLRFGSIAKPMTHALLKILQKQGRLRLSDYAFCFHGASRQGRCWLAIPAQWSVAVGWSAVTLQDLLQHQGGLPSRHDDPALLELRVARQLGIPAPPSRMDLLRFALQKPPQTAVGTTKAYSNLGYELLGLIAEQAGGKSYLELLQEWVLAPVQVAEGEVQAARSLPQDRHPREPDYVDDTLVTSVFPPHGSVFAPDGGYHEENLLAAGGMIGSARAIAQFMKGFWLGSGDVRRPGEVGQLWQMEGVQRGMHALAEQWTQGGQDITFVALFNGYDAARAAALPGELEEGLRQVYGWPGGQGGAGAQRVEVERVPQLLALLNQVRKSGRRCGAQEMAASGPLQWQESLAQAVLGHAREQIQGNRPGLLSADGTDLFARWRRQGYRSAGGYEYVLWLDGDLGEAVARWLDKEALCQAVLRPALKDMGAALAVRYDGTGRQAGKQLLVLDLAIPER
ncbi:MAG: serine hydrolase [Magnetococcales bacterium]|nr:serine hydrolase [Magnetococcales bacterium]MBF0115530.1 serine hydrolase [Magnetococcales bacterium]